MKLNGIEKITDILKIVDEAENIVILAHEDPDGDAIGASLGIYNYLEEYFGFKDIYKNVDIVLKNVPEKFKIIKNFDKILNDFNDDIDLLIVVDLNKKERLGEFEKLVDKAKNILIIDHHMGDANFGTYIISKVRSASTTLLLADIYNSLKHEVDLPIPSKDVVTPIFIGVLTDTAGFKNTNINKEVFEFIVKAMGYGINISELYFAILENKTKNELALKKLVLNRLEYYENNRIAISYLFLSDEVYLNRASGEHDILPDILRGIVGVDVGLLIRETKEGFKASIRTKKDFDATKIAKHFNGGGHFTAAGITLKDKDFEKFKKELVEKSKEEINK